MCPSKFRTLIVTSVITFLAIYYAYYIFLGLDRMVDLKKQLIYEQYAGKNSKYGVYLEHCKTPLVDLYTEGYGRYYRERPELMEKMSQVCENNPEFSKIENGKLFLTDRNLENCCLAEITRDLKDPLDNNTLTHCVQIDNQQSLDIARLEFFLVKCDDPKLSNASIYNFHANVPVTGSLKPKIEFWKNKSSERPFSIFALVIDSTSRAEMFRSLTETMDLLLNQMNFVDFRGHHPLGEPTQFNVMPMLMGIQRSTFQRNYFGFKEQKFWDKTPFIWHAFNKLNYITGYFEDDPSVGTFNYGKQLGFEEQPTTLYTRPLMAAHSLATNYSKYYSYKNYCFGRRNVIEFMLDYHLETLERLAEVPTFQVTWPCWIQHNYGGSLSFLDKTYLNFFKKISQNSQLMENALFMVLSDHGFYNIHNDSYPNTYPSLLERRNVPLFIRLPDSLARSQPEVRKNLRKNSELITSHYDLYQTFLQIAKMAGHVDPPSNLTTYGTSLLEQIPQNRTCREARIPKTMCLCNVPFRTASWSLFETGVLIDKAGFDIFE